MRLVVGARFACRRCLRRGFLDGCAKCGDPSHVVELGSPEGEAWLQRFRASGPEGRKVAWRALRPGRVVFGIAAVSALVGAMLGAAEGAGGAAVGALGGAFMGPLLLVTLGLTVVTIWLVLVLAVLLLAMLATLCGLLLRALRLDLPSRVGKRLLSGAAWMIGVLEHPLGVKALALPGWRPAPRAASLRGTLEAPGDLLVVASSEVTHVPLRDAVVAPLRVRTGDGRVVAVEVDAGAVDLDRAALASAELADPPSWLASVSPRARRVRLAEGARIEVVGGVWSERAAASGALLGYREAPRESVLRGGAGSPLLLRFR